MDKLHEWLIAKPESEPFKENVITEGNTRITVILPGVIRIENCSSPNGFTDKPTQSIWYRNHGKVSFSVEIKGGNIHVKTDKADFCVKKSNGKPVYTKTGNMVSKCNNAKNLKGTARTLDQTFGPIPLKDGVASKDGAAIVDDSDSLLIGDSGMVEARPQKESDIYVFCFGTNYIGAVKALYKLSGDVPLVPRFTLGNWWSRYRAYTQDEYQNLMLEFKKKEIPLTVATVDMDWHWVDLKAKFGKSYSAGGLYQFLGSGWTGYSWNTDLFPDYRGFLNFLHGMDLKIPLNLHPADGIRPFETMYENTAKSMGVDPASEKTIEFDMTDSKFINTYFDEVHHPYENDGVDFWWIDWQQGKKSKLAGLDPLWALNHYHYLDMERSGKRPLILSRYAGIGSHRYPLGFSGDTAMNWHVLNFQPYFTSTAANCGYTWWSHDIGGHHHGRHDDEMYVRWLQLGVFSPIVRLHSTSNDLFGKEPWNFSWDAELLATELLRLRHKLIPYIYSMNYRTHFEGRALCEPLYYNYPNEADAYKCRNGFMFGTELLVCPVTKPINKHTKTAETNIWLPGGRWTNLFNGKIYEGGKTICVHSELNGIPAFAREGAIIPMSEDCGNQCDNPKKLKLKVYRGNNKFSLFEDDGESNDFKNGDYVETTVEINENSDIISLLVWGSQKKAYMPEKRSYVFDLADIISAEKITVTANSEEIGFTVQKSDNIIIETNEVPVDTEISVKLETVKTLENKPYFDRVLEIMTRYNGANLKKSTTYMGLKKNENDLNQLTASAHRVKNPNLRRELLEALCDMK